MPQLLHEGHSFIVVSDDVQTRPFKGGSGGNELVVQAGLCERLWRSHVLVEDMVNVLDSCCDNARATSGADNEAVEFVSSEAVKQMRLKNETVGMGKAH